MSPSPVLSLAMNLAKLQLDLTEKMQAGKAPDLQTIASFAHVVGSVQAVVAILPETPAK